jgi:hypothetical protein
MLNNAVAQGICTAWLEKWDLFRITFQIIFGSLLLHYIFQELQYIIKPSPKDQNIALSEKFSLYNTSDDARDQEYGCLESGH